ncbi:MAG: metal-dependent hydrolase [Halolamina sp.]
MHKTGHVGAALLAFGPIGFVAGAIGGAEVVLLAGGVAAGLASVPDVDTQVPFVPHRGPTHTVWFAALVGIGVAFGGFLVGLQTGVLVGIALGVLGAITGTVAIASHLAADALTPMGIRPFTPWCERHYTWDLVSAANPIANYALLGLGGAVGIGLSMGGVWLHQAV